MKILCRRLFHERLACLRVYLLLTASDKYEREERVSAFLIKIVIYRLAPHDVTVRRLVIYCGQHYLLRSLSLIFIKYAVGKHGCIDAH